MWKHCRTAALSGKAPNRCRSRPAGAATGAASAAGRLLGFIPHDLSNTSLPYTLIPWFVTTRCFDFRDGWKNRQCSSSSRSNVSLGNMSIINPFVNVSCTPPKRSPRTFWTTPYSSAVSGKRLFTRSSKRFGPVSHFHFFGALSGSPAGKNRSSEATSNPGGPPMRQAHWRWSAPSPTNFQLPRKVRTLCRCPNSSHTRSTTRPMAHQGNPISTLRFSSIVFFIYPVALRET